MKNQTEIQKLAERANAERRQKLYTGQLILGTAGSILATVSLYLSGLPKHSDIESDLHIVTLFGLLVALFGIVNFKNNK